MSELVG